MTKTALVYTPLYLGHETGRHPENPGRLLAVMSHLDREGLLVDRPIFEPEAAPFEAIAAVHDHRLIRAVLDAAEAGGRWLDGDTYVSPGSYDAAAFGSGGALVAVDAVLHDDPSRVFVLPRPPGHHATPGRAMGFCLFNHVAVAAQYALDQHGLERVAIIDWDVHHGNGTQDIFYDSGRVFYASIHQSPLYPGTGQRDERGEGEGTGTTLNVPLPPGADDARHLRVLDDEILPVVRAYRPQLIFVSAGFDAHREDPLAGLKLGDADYSWVTRELCYVANKHANGRIVSTLEGGYALSALGRAAAEHVKELIAG